MLGKLLKYEFRATARMLLPAYIVALVFALFFNFTADFSDFRITSSVHILLAFFYGVSVAAIIILTVVLTIRRFYSSLFKDEGYLSHTLPVSVDAHILGKLIPAFCWLIASGFVTAFSVYIIAHDAWFFPVFWQDFLRGIRGLFAYGPHLILPFLSSIVGILSFILAFYSALSIGQLAHRRKFLFSVLAYVVMSIVFSIVFDLILFSPAVWDFGHSVENALSLAFNIVQAGIHYLIIRYILKNRLNLE